METEPVRFNLRLKQIPVVLEDDNGQDHSFTIRELSGHDIESFLEENRSRVDLELDDKGKTRVKSIKSYKGLHTSLLKLCLYDEQGVRVPVKDIDRYPHEVQKKLYEIAQDINGLKDKDKDEDEESEGN